jgi:hypothetical protein
VAAAAQPIVLGTQRAVLGLPPPRAPLDGRQRLAEAVDHHRLVPTARLQPLRHKI